jgi:hypothetical protein
LPGLAAIVASGCAPRFHLAFETAHFRYYVEQGVAPPCAGAADWIERFGRAVAEFEEEDPDGVEKASYFQYASFEELVAEGCASGSGCTAGLTVRASFPLDRHEIVHTYTHRIGDPPSFLQEGLAGVLDCVPIRDSPQWAPAPPLDDVVTSEAFLAGIASGRNVIQSAEYFMRWLLEAHGKAPVLKLLRSLPWGASRDEVDAAFRDVLGESLADAFASWRASRWVSLPSADAACIFALEGSAGPIAGVDGDWVSLTPRCQDDQFTPYDQVRVDVPLEGAWIELQSDTGAATATYSVDMFGAEGVSIADSVQVPAEAQSLIVPDVPPGTYFLSVRGPGQPLGVRVHDRAPLVDRPGEAPIALAVGATLNYVASAPDVACSQAAWCPGAALDILPSSDGALDGQAVFSSPYGYELPDGAVQMVGGQLISPDLLVCASGDTSCSTAPSPTPLRAGSPVRIGMHFKAESATGLWQATLVDDPVKP